MTQAYTLVERDIDLDTLTQHLGSQQAIAVDIEADSFHHYYPKTCLIQLATSLATFVVDPLALETMEPLKPILESAHIKKVFHGADYDLRSLYRDYAIRPQNIFDTMIASRFLGEKDLGLAAILKNRYGVILDKKYQKANWAKRPLPEAMLLYAAYDTAYLIHLWQTLKASLVDMGRHDWVEEECQLLIEECTGTDAETTSAKQRNKRKPRGLEIKKPLFRRFKGAGTMSPRDLAVLEGILVYREKIAMQRDRPPFKIFSNAVIKKLVQVKPTDKEALLAIPGIPVSFVTRYSRGILKVIQKTVALPKKRLPLYPKTRRPPSNPGKQSRLKKLKSWRTKKAKELDLDPGLVCNNSLLENLAQANPQSYGRLGEITDMRIWQKKVLGKDIVETLQRH